MTTFSLPHGTGWTFANLVAIWLDKIFLEVLISVFKNRNKKTKFANAGCG